MESTHVAKQFIDNYVRSTILINIKFTKKLNTLSDF